MSSYRLMCYNLAAIFYFEIIPKFEQSLNSLQREVGNLFVCQYRNLYMKEIRKDCREARFDAESAEKVLEKAYCICCFVDTKITCGSKTAVEFFDDGKTHW